MARQGMARQGMDHNRREFPPRIRAAAFERCGGRCEGCGEKVMPKQFAYDHVLPDWLGGEPTLDNCCVLCNDCHKAKTTKSDIPMIAKTKRVRAKHIGAKVSKRPLPGSRASGWKRTFNNGWVKR